MKLLILLAALAATLSAQAPAPAIGPNTVVAHVGDKEVTVSDVERMASAIGPEFVQNLRTAPAQMLQNWFLVQYLASEAEKLKLDQESPVKDVLAYRRNFELAQQMINHETNFVIEEQQLQSYYASNQARYLKSKVKVIVIGFRAALPPGASAQAIQQRAQQAASDAALGIKIQRSEGEAKTLANDLVKKLREGADFGKLVAENSDDASSKAIGGDFGMISSTSSFPEDFKKAVSALKVGEVSDPVRQSSGYYIIRCEEKSLQPYEEVAGSISQDLRVAHSNEFMKKVSERFTPKIERPEFFQGGPAPVPPRAVAPPPGK